MAEGLSHLSQEGRIASLETPLGKDVLVALRFDGNEAVSELFEFRIEALSEQKGIDFDKAIGNNCSLTFRTYDGPERIFNGVLVQVQGLGAEADLFRYRLTLRPWLWLLSHTSNCRIFKNQKAPDIIEKVFRDRGFSDFRDATTGTFPELEYCVQYRETDLIFVSRLMEQHGIYYFFEHSKDKHMLVLADSKSSHNPVPGHPKIPFIADEYHRRRDQEHLFHWRPERRFRSGKFELNDYDYLQPNADLKSDAEGSASYNRSKMEIYDYPGKFKQKDDGETYAKVRLQAEQAMDQRRYGEGDAVSLFAGALLTLEKHPQNAENKEYLILRASHSYQSESYRSAGFQNGETYSGSYEFIASDNSFRAPLITPRPIVHGPQTARVVAEEGTSEEIDVDEHGRILVHFFWDRENKQSCRARVAQVWAGKGWGGQIIPRIGQEVIVEYLEGDPDRPIVTGAVYNADNKYPYEMPANKTQSGRKSDSSKGHGGYNEFMFEDKKDSENIRMHAQKDYNVTILNSEMVTIGENFESPTGSPSHKTTIKNGDRVLDVSSGAILTSAKVKIELKVGPSKITIDPTGITLEAPTITIKAETTCVIQGLPVKIN
ncbi:MAG TPA: type VI secretion system tip protein TssI/VgrG [Methylocella sp.]|nr:type VI secretion system tip protein TssI/VgrG [Methylocella sp.]